MTAEHALVIYKNKSAIVKEISEGKFTILLQDGASARCGAQVKVRDKDIELLHPGPVKNFEFIELSGAPDIFKKAKEAWELLSDERSSLSLKDFSSFVFNEYTPSSAYAAYCLLKDGLYFSGSTAAVECRSKDDVACEEAKRAEKQREADERASFLERLKYFIKNSANKKTEENHLPAGAARFLQDVEALACGKTAKSRTMKELDLGETPQDAHALLLSCGFWSNAVNPHPGRFGVSLNRAVICPEAPSPEGQDGLNRADLCHLDAFAIDSPWSRDPDDAVSIEEKDGKTVLYVHVSDPACSIAPDSPAEKEARDRGATLYLPENTVRMLADEALPFFALGMSEKSPALTFKMTFNDAGRIINTEIFPSVVKVRRITYEQADIDMGNAESAGSRALRSLYDLAARINKRRSGAGAVNIELPETNITVENENVTIEPVAQYKSASLVRECMISAGEGAGTWAAVNGIAFPYISQETEIQGKIPGGLAGSWQLRRCMRPRVLSAKPGRHCGMGLDIYTQVTSPLRRYTDFLAHMQIHAFLGGRKPLEADEVMARLAAGEAAASAAVQAERASRIHWTMVYLSGKKESVWEAVVLEKKGNRVQTIIPSLALETQVSIRKDVAPNELLKLTLKSVNIPRGEAVFVSG
ncbi:MAG: RNB domain-containing ribonuclease [Treponema sp.]|jgi:exoribonuclease-2|nr:RNB domain-containing ribonuclease [Treponema sp.]